MKPPSKSGSGGPYSGRPRPHGGDGPGRDGPGRDGPGRKRAHHAGAGAHGGPPRRFAAESGKSASLAEGRGRNERATPERATQGAHPESRPVSRPGALHLPDRQDQPRRELSRGEGGHQAGRSHRGADTPHGAAWLYGLHAVAAALANPARRLRRLLLTEDAEAQLLDGQPADGRAWPLVPERVDRARLAKLLGRDLVHQGVALLVDPLPSPSLQQALERPGPVLVLDQVADPRNVGAILRCAAAFRAAAVIAQDRNAPDETGALAKAASGALETVPMLRAVNIARTLVALRAAGLWIVGLAAQAPPLSGPALAERRVALVLGSEGDGMRRLTRESCDELAGIAMPGAGDLMESLNVSAAAAVALYEIGRRA